MSEGLRLSIGQCATLACVLEVTAPKPGNVHRGADFEDMTFTDFLVSAMAIGPAMENAVSRGVGETALAAIQNTRDLVRVNTNLGTVLLLAPLAAVPRSEALREGVAAVLRELTARDARLVYEAIRCASPGGLGQTDQMDVHEEPPQDLRQAMSLAASWDRVAHQFAHDFEDVFSLVAPGIEQGLAQGWTLTSSIIHVQLSLLSRFSDSLIARKCGVELAKGVQQWAQAVLDSGDPGEDTYEQRLADFDFWLRSDRHRRNPGTTADLIAAGLFVCLRDGRIQPPFA